MPAREQVAFQPALALVLAQHFEHAAVGGQKFVGGFHGRVPLPGGGFKHGFETVGKRFIGPKNAEVARLCVQP